MHAHERGRGIKPVSETAETTNFLLTLPSMRLECSRYVGYLSSWLGDAVELGGIGVFTVGELWEP